MLAVLTQNGTVGFHQKALILTVICPLPDSTHRIWNKSSLTELKRTQQGESAMEAVIDRVMQTYGMLVNLTPEQEHAAREKVSSFLANVKIEDEQKLAVEGLRYLRTSR